MSIINRSVCCLCQAMRSISLQSNITSRGMHLPVQQTVISSALIQRRDMSTKIRKYEVDSVHRKDAACVGEGDKKYEPQSPYREHWPRHYGWENNLFGGGPLPKLDKPLKRKPEKKVVDHWDADHALFGQNDYIDILGDGNVRPVDLMNGPSWLRGFRGNEMQRVIRRLQFQGPMLQQLYPTKYHDLQKRIDYLYKHYNIHRSKRIGKGRRRVMK